MSTTNSKWLPPQLAGFGPWIERTRGSGAPVLSGEVRICTSWERQIREYVPSTGDAAGVNWDGETAASAVVAYCVKLEEQPVEPQQPAASGLTRLVPLRQKALHTLEETTISDPQVAFWGVSITGVPMVRLATLADAQLVQRLADAAFQAGRQKAFSDLADWVSARP